MVAKKPSGKPAVPVPYSSLISLFGKELDDTDVQAVLAASGKVAIKKPTRDGQYVVCKEAGYTLLLRPVAGAPKGTPMRVHQLFLHYDGQDGHRGYAFPHGVAYKALQTEIRAILGEPADASNPYLDQWHRDGVLFGVSYGGDPKYVIDVRITAAT